MNIVKYLQLQGIGSRKYCQQLLNQGLVSINQQLVAKDAEIQAQSVKSLWIDDSPFIVIPLPVFCILLNKPQDYEVSHKPKGYPSVFSLLPAQIRNIDIQSIGRLDADTTGLLLITNDGVLNHRITSPKHLVEKEYLVRMKHPVTTEQQQQLLDGVLLHQEHEIVAAKKVELLDNNQIKLTITSGKYHQVKRMLAAVGNRVEVLHRFRLGNLELPDSLSLGEWCFINPNSIV